jgi:methylase of polypeptide subunit release factors
MKQFIIEGKTIFYDTQLDGGGTTFGINSLKNQLVEESIKRGSIMEMCSGPGFMGFYLNFKGMADELVLVDINSENLPFIEKTIISNGLTNTKFIQSDGFNDVDDTLFDTIIINPPHYASPREGGYPTIHEELISLDDDMYLHQEFFENASKYLKKDGVILLIGNMGGITPEDVKDVAGDGYNIELIACERFGWIRDSKFYVLKITLNG